MATNPLQDRDSYELIENDAGELMITLYANPSQPQKPSFSLNIKEQSLELVRNSEDTIVLDGLAPETIERLSSLTNIYVCEIKYDEENQSKDDFDIAYIYIAEHKKKIPEEKSPQQTLQEKLQQTKERVLEKRNYNQQTSNQPK